MCYSPLCYIYVAERCVYCFVCALGVYVFFVLSCKCCVAVFMFFFVCRLSSFCVSSVERFNEASMPSHANIALSIYYCEASFA